MMILGVIKHLTTVFLQYEHSRFPPNESLLLTNNSLSLRRVFLVDEG